MKWPVFLESSEGNWPYLKMRTALFYKRIHWGEDRRLPPCSIRAYFIAKLYQYVKGETSFCKILDHAELIHLIVLGEYIITQFYLENHINDRKYRIWEPKREADNLKEQNYITNQIPIHIQESFSENKADWIQEKVDFLFSLYRVGIELDQQALNFRNFDNWNCLDFLSDSQIKNYLDINYFIRIAFNGLRLESNFELNKNYLQLYLNRSYLINGIFFQCFSEIVTYLFASKHSNFDELIEFSRVFGMMQQIVNDNFDFIPIEFAYPTSTKLKEDTFSDARRRLITLPVICYYDIIGDQNTWVSDHFSTRTKKDIDLSKNEQQLEMLDELCTRGALDRAMKITKRIAEYSIDNSSLDRANPSTDFLLDMQKIAVSNKFYIFYKDFESKKIRSPNDD